MTHRFRSHYVQRVSIGSERADQPQALTDQRTYVAVSTAQINNNQHERFKNLGESSTNLRTKLYPVESGVVR